MLAEEFYRLFAKEQDMMIGQEDSLTERER